MPIIVYRAASRALAGRVREPHALGDSACALGDLGSVVAPANPTLPAVGLCRLPAIALAGRVRCAAGATDWPTPSSCSCIVVADGDGVCRLPAIALDGRDRWAAARCELLDLFVVQRTFFLNVSAHADGERRGDLRRPEGT